MFIGMEKRSEIKHLVNGNTKLIEASDVIQFAAGERFLQRI